MDQRKANANAANANADETLESPGELESELSIADISKRHSNPKRWVLYFAILLVAVVVPYWAGRTWQFNTLLGLLRIFLDYLRRELCLLLGLQQLQPLQLWQWR